MSATKRFPLPRLPDGLTLVDTHCHLDFPDFQADLGQVLERAARGGVRRVLTVGIDHRSSVAAVELAASLPGVSATVGVHPHHVAGLTDDGYRQLKELARHPAVKAYGEIGLDYVKEYAERKIQQLHFARQVELALDCGLPVIIHDREAHGDVLNILKERAGSQVRGVMHCFSGDRGLAEEVLALGMHISIPGVVTFKNAQAMQEVARMVPLDRLLLETDGPFLTPHPYRGKRNEPLFVLYTAQKVAELRSTTLGEIARATTANAENLFGLSTMLSVDEESGDGEGGVA